MRSRLNLQLMAAVKCNNITTAQRLMAQGADPNWKELPSNLNTLDTLDYYFPSVLTRDRIMQPSMLMVAADSGYDDMITMLLAHGANIHADDTCKGWTCLDLAIARCHRNTVHLLVSKGASLTTQGPGAVTPLMLAAKCADANTIDVLLQHGASVSAKSETGCTPLMFAAQRHSDEMASVILSFDQRVNTQDDLGRTALFYAARIGNVRTVKLLLSHGADPNIRTVDGKTVLSYMQPINPTNKDLIEVICLLKLHGAR